jgi:Fe-S-cluster containining protein
MICKMAHSELFDAVYRAAGRAEVRRAVTQIYDDLQRAIDVRRPVCNTSGRCCRFEEFGHRLYVTTMELASFAYELEMGSAKPQAAGTWDGTGCPYQVAGLCGVHAIRPFGCRIFFCDASSTQWQQDHYERFHATMKTLHETLRVPYFYVEWRSALRILSIVWCQAAGEGGAGTPGSGGAGSPGDGDVGIHRS